MKFFYFLEFCSWGAMSVVFAVVLTCIRNSADKAAVIFGLIWVALIYENVMRHRRW